MRELRERERERVKEREGTEEVGLASETRSEIRQPPFMIVLVDCSRWDLFEGVCSD